MSFFKKMRVGSACLLRWSKGAGWEDDRNDGE